jgi:hypothetical protein
MPAERLRKQAEKTYVENTELKLREIFTFCHDHKVKLAVLPEYSVPVSAIRALLSFQTDLCIVAGIGALRGQDIALLGDFGFDVSHIAQGMNCAVLIGPDTKKLVSKKFPAHEEIIHLGAGVVAERVSLDGATVTIGVGICLDAIKMKTCFNDPIPDIVAIPALSRTSSEFRETPRDFLRLYANHGQFGGSFVGAPSIKGPGLADDRGTIPLPPRTEGVTIIDWDLRQRAQTKPTSTNPPGHTIYARSSLIYRGRDPQVAAMVQRLIESAGTGQPISGDVAQIANELLSLPTAQLDSYPVLVENSRQLVDRYDVLLPEEIHALARHCILGEKVFAFPEWSYSQSVAVAVELRRWQDTLPIEVSSSYGKYEDHAKHLAVSVRRSITLPRHMTATASVDSVLPHDRMLVFYGTLGSYSTEEAAATFPRQLTLLRTLATLGDPTVALIYRLRGARSPSGAMNAVYEIICTAGRRPDPELAALREGFGQLLGVTFGGAYSLSYSHRDVEPTELDELLERGRHSYEVRREVGPNGKVREFDGFTDWSIVVDLVRALETEVEVEMCCIGLPASDAEGHQSADSANASLMVAILQGQQELRHVPLYLGSAAALRDMASDQSDVRRLALQISVKSKEEIPLPVVKAIAAEIAGSSRWEILDQPTPLLDRPMEELLRDASLLYRPAQVLRVFHPGLELSRSLLNLAERDGTASYPQFTAMQGIPT